MSKVYRRNGRFGIDYTSATGRRVRTLTDARSLKEARELLRAKLAEETQTKILGRPSTANVKPVLFGEYYREKYLPFHEARCRPSTVRGTEHQAVYVLPFFGHMPLRSITAGHVEEYVTRRLKEKKRLRMQSHSNRWINLERGLVSRVLNHAFRAGLVDVIEVARIRPLREKARDVWLRPGDVSLILEHAEPWVRPIILVAVHTGMREGEICRLRWTQLEHSPGFVRIGDESKTHKTRFVPVNSVVEEIFETQMRYFGEKGPVGFVFVNGRRRKPYRGSSAYHSFKKATELAAGRLRKLGRREDAKRISSATFHTLRHTFASWLIQAGVPIAKVQQYLGHAGDHMTRRYAHLAPASKEDRKTLEILVKVGTNPAPEKADSCAPKPKTVTS